MTGAGRLMMGGLMALALTACWKPGDETQRPTGQTQNEATDTAPRFARTTIDAALLDEIRTIESRVGGRLGVMLVSPDDQLVLANRETERFPICSTFKLPLAVMVLSDVDNGQLKLDRKLSLNDRRVVEHSPVVAAMKRDGKTEISVEAALAASLVQSDNSAANLLLTLVGDNSGYSRRIEQAFGSDSIRMDRSEGVLNEDAARDEDTATPDAMVAVLARVFHGSALSDIARGRLRGWMADARTGVHRVRAGLPDGMEAGDKTGTCTRTYNSVGWIAASPGAKPWLYAVYLDETNASESDAEAALADVGRLFGRIARPANRPADVAK